jgi:hypothetical protein
MMQDDDMDGWERCEAALGLMGKCGGRGCGWARLAVIMVNFLGKGHTLGKIVDEEKLKHMQFSYCL